MLVHSRLVHNRLVHNRLVLISMTLLWWRCRELCAGIPQITFNILSVLESISALLVERAVQRLWRLKVLCWQRVTTGTHGPTLQISSSVPERMHSIGRCGSSSMSFFMGWIRFAKCLISTWWPHLGLSFCHFSCDGFKFLFTVVRIIIEALKRIVCLCGEGTTLHIFLFVFVAFPWLSMVDSHRSTLHEWLTAMSRLVLWAHPLTLIGGSNFGGLVSIVMRLSINIVWLGIRSLGKMLTWLRHSSAAWAWLTTGVTTTGKN
mmetsp:Transcript_10090/g.22133  ORF Transcript_10090/g.22133 Transcript_10090/m.22133 type:complete len:261 (-) Transcript_10090:2676-3458(-)